MFDFIVGVFVFAFLAIFYTGILVEMASSAICDIQHGRVKDGKSRLVFTAVLGAFLLLCLFQMFNGLFIGG